MLSPISVTEVYSERVKIARRSVSSHVRLRAHCIQMVMQTRDPGTHSPQSRNVRKHETVNEQCPGVLKHSREVENKLCWAFISISSRLSYKTRRNRETSRDFVDVYDVAGPARNRPIRRVRYGAPRSHAPLPVRPRRSLLRLPTLTAILPDYRQPQPHAPLPATPLKARCSSST